MALPALPGVSGSDKTAADRANGVVTGTLTAAGPSKAFSVFGPFVLALWGARKTSVTTTVGSATVTVGSNTGLAAGDAINSTLVPPGTTASAAPSGSSVNLAFMPQYWPGSLQSGVAAITGMTAGDGLGGTSPASLASLVGATILNSPYFASGVTVQGVGPDGTSLQLSAAPTSVPATVGPVSICFAPTANVITTAGTDANATFTGAAENINATVNLERSFDGGQTWLLCNRDNAGTLAQFTLNTPVSCTFGNPEAGMLFRLNAIAFSAVSGVAANYRLSTTGQSSTTLSVPTA